MADDLAFEFLGADVVGLGSGLLALEGQGPSFSKSLEQLIIPLSGEVVLLGRAGGAEPFALPFDEHDQARGEWVLRGDEEFSGGPDDAVGMRFEFHNAELR